MQLGAFLKLIRWKNLAFIIYVQLLLKYVVFSSLKVGTNLDSIHYMLLLLGIVFIAAAGYIINDIHDLKTDLINRPEKVIISKGISVEKAIFLYRIINTLGILMGVVLSLQIEKPTYSLLFISTSILLYYYSKYFKSKPLIGNVLVSLFISLSIAILFLLEFDHDILMDRYLILNSIFIFLIGFAFMLNLIREIVKDIQDVNGDHALQMKTLPIVLGVDRTRRIASIFGFITVFCLVYLSVPYMDRFSNALYYLFISVIVPLLYVSIKLFSVRNKPDFGKLSELLKIVMFLGVNTVILILA